NFVTYVPAHEAFLVRAISLPCSPATTMRYLQERYLESMGKHFQKRGINVLTVRERPNKPQTEQIESSKNDVSDGILALSPNWRFRIYSINATETFARILCIAL